MTGLLGVWPVVVPGSAGLGDFGEAFVVAWDRSVEQGVREGGAPVVWPLQTCCRRYSGSAGRTGPQPRGVHQLDAGPALAAGSL